MWTVGTFVSEYQLLFQCLFQALVAVRRDGKWAFVFPSLSLKTGTLIHRNIYYIDIPGAVLH